MPSSAVIYKSIKTTKALECLQDMLITGRELEILGFAVSSRAGNLDPDRTIDDTNPTWYPATGTYTPFLEAPSRASTKLTFVMQIPAGITNAEVYMTEMYIYARYDGGSVFLFAICQTQTNPADFRYIPNTTYTQTANFDLTQYKDNLNVIINQVTGILAKAPLNLDENGNLDLMLDETLTQRDNGELGIKAITNFIAHKDGNASFSGNTITLPDMSLYIPNGRNSRDEILNRIISVSSKSYDMSEYTEAGIYYMFYNSDNDSIHATPEYYKHYDTSPEEGSYGAIVYLNDNFMYMVQTVAPNYLISGGVNVSEGGTVSRLGTLSMNIQENIPTYPEVNLSFNTGDDITNTQSLFNSSYALATIANSKLSVYLTSYLYGVDYYKLMASGRYYLQEIKDVNEIILGGRICYLVSNDFSLGTIVYVDTNLSVPLGTVTELSSSSTTIEYIEVQYSGYYDIEYSGKLITYYMTNGNVYYAKDYLEAGDSVYLSNTFESSSYKVFSITPTEIVITVFKDTLIYDDESDPEELGYYTYYVEDDNGRAYYYTRIPITLGATIYVDTALDNILGQVVEVDNVLITVGQISSYTTSEKEYSMIICSGNRYYLNTSTVEVNKTVYSDSNFESTLGEIVDITEHTIVISTSDLMYQGIYQKRKDSIYKYEIEGRYIYSLGDLQVGREVFLDFLLNNIYGIVESLTPNNLVIHSANIAHGYTVIKGEPTFYMPEGYNIYTDTSMTTVGSLSTVENAIYTEDTVASDIEGNLEIPMEANKHYSGKFWFTGDFYALELTEDGGNPVLSKVITSRVPYSEGYMNFILGGINGFSGTYDLVHTNITNIWNWNGHNSEVPDWAKEPLCELGTFEVEDGIISSVSLNKPVEIAKFTDLGNIEYGSNSKDYGKLIVTTLPRINDKTVLLANGIELASNDKNYRKFVKFVMDIAQLSEYANLFTDINTYTSLVQQYGECNQYVCNTITGTIKLPTLNGILGVVTAMNSAGLILPAGLPTLTAVNGGEHSHSVSVVSASGHTHTRGTMNITGQFPGDDSVFGRHVGYVCSGCFYDAGRINLDWDSHGGGGSWCGFDASRTWEGATSSSGAHSHTATCDNGGAHAHSVQWEGHTTLNTVRPQTANVLVYIKVK